MSNKIEIIISAVDQASATFNGFRGKVDKLSGQIGASFRGIMSIPNLIAGAALVGMGKKFVETADKVEIFRMQLLAVSKTAEEADSALSAIREFARVSPLETEDVVQAYVRMRAIGMSPTIEQMEVLGGVAFMFHQKMTDALDGFIGLNKRTLRQYGIEIDRTGKQAIIQSGNITKTVAKDSASVRQALIEIWQKRFPGALEKASETFSAKMEILKSNIWEFAAQLTSSFMPILGGSVDNVRKRMESVIGKVKTIATVLSYVFEVIEQGFRGLVLIVKALWSGVVTMLNYTMKILLSFPVMVLQTISKAVLKVRDLIDQLLSADFVPQWMKEKFAGVSGVFTTAANAMNSAAKPLVDTIEFGDNVMNGFADSVIDSAKGMEDAALRWGNVRKNIEEMTSETGGKLPSSPPNPPSAPVPTSVEKKEKSKIEKAKSEYEELLTEAENRAAAYFAYMDTITTDEMAKETLRYQKELYDFVNSRDAMYLSDEQFQNATTALKQKHAALRNSIAKTETEAQWSMYSEFGQSMMSLSSEIIAQSVKDSREQRDLQIAMALINAAAAAVAIVYSAATGTGDVYEKVLKGIAGVAAIAATTIPQIAAMQSQSFAVGTSYAPGGVARLHQDETVFLPRGSRVATARESAQNSVNISVNFGGGVTRETLPDIRKSMRELGDKLKYGIRGGMIRPSQIGLAPA